MIHQKGQILCTGQFKSHSLPGINWSCEASEGIATREFPLDIERFEFLWESIFELEIFTSSPRQRDFVCEFPTKSYLVGATVDDTESGANDSALTTVYRVDVHAEKDKDFWSWLEALNCPWQDWSEADLRPLEYSMFQISPS